MLLENPSKASSLYDNQPLGLPPLPHLLPGMVGEYSTTQICFHHYRLNEQALKDLNLVMGLDLCLSFKGTLCTGNMKTRPVGGKQGYRCTIKSNPLENPRLTQGFSK